MERKPEVLALVTDAFGGRGGIAQYNRDFLSSLATHGGVSSITIIPRNAPDKVDSSAEITQLPPRSGRIAYALAALRLVLSKRVDVVFCGHLYTVPLALVIARLSRAKLIVQLHGIEAWKRPAFPLRMATEAADIILCVSRYTRACVLSWAAIAPERVLVLPNTVDENFHPGDGSSLRAKLGAAGKFVLLSVGRMSSQERYKGHDKVISAMPELLKGGHDVLYVIVGDGDDVGRLKALADELGVAERMRFTGAVKQEELISFYQMADLFVLPSTGEGFGIAFLEAMACGTPALGLAVAGASDALVDGELGIAVAEADFTAVLAQMLKQPRPSSEALAAAVRNRFGRDVFIDRVSAIFDRLMKRDGRSIGAAQSTLSR